MTYRTHVRYNTKSNKCRKVKIPGGKLSYHKVTKLAGKVKCGDCKMPLNGIAQCRPTKMGSIAKRKRKVTRVHGGSRCASCVTKRIMRAFLTEEARNAKQVLTAKAKEDKPEEKKKS